MRIDASGPVCLQAWRGLLRRSSLPSSTKLVCLNLSLYMDARAAAWPSVREQVRDTGLKPRSVLKHLEIARREGYLTWAADCGFDFGDTARIYGATFPGSLLGRGVARQGTPPTSLPMALQLTGRGLESRLIESRQ